ncbi:MAG: repeat containing protein [Verrucomicrobiota bacterium]
MSLVGRHFICGILPLVLLVGIVSVWGEGADDDYVRLFEGIRKAEQMEARGDREGAQGAFTDLKGGLLHFQATNPMWHPEVVAYRLRYVGAALERLSEVRDGEKVEQAEEVNGVQTEDLLRARLRQLELEREELRAKLREALAPRPAVMATPELTAAEEKIRVLEKELALHRFAAQSEKSTPGITGVREREEDFDGRIAKLEEDLALERQTVQLLKSTAEQLQERLRVVARGESGGEGIEEDVAETADVAKLDSDPLEEGRSLVVAEDWESAIRVLSVAAQDGDAGSEVLVLLARALIGNGMTGPAEAVLRRALGKDASCAEAHALMARLCLGRTPPARSLARWHYHEARRYGVGPDVGLENELE